jgi:hypothetical protein
MMAPVFQPAPAARRVHPAVQLLTRVEGMWQDNPKIAGDRACLIVQRLIEAGFLVGTMRGGLPLAPDEQPTHPQGLGPQPPA